MRFIKDIIGFLRLRHQLMKIYKEENLIKKLSDLYSLDFKTDRAARLYAVMNPALHSLKNNGTGQIFSYTVDGMTDYEYIRQWIFTNLMAIAPALAAVNLLDVLLFDMREITYEGKPSGNYLITFTPYNFSDFERAKKILYWVGGIMITLITIILILI